MLIRDLQEHISSLFKNIRSILNCHRAKGIMSKRKENLTDKSQNVNNKKSKKHWSLGLLESMEDPDSVYKQTKRIVVIRDKYPKAKIHYLMLPRDNITDIYKLGKDDICLLEEFGKLYKLIKEEHAEYEICAGFHAIPSMQRLHMHIISKDMVSPCLKTKVHWNSFTTKFFKPFENVLEELKDKGFITKITNDVHKSLMTTPLKCNQCNYVPKNMPQLKEHLLNHV